MDGLLGLALLFNMRPDSGVSDEEVRDTYRDKSVKRLSLKMFFILAILFAINLLVIHLTEDYVILNLLLYMPLAFLILPCFGFLYLYIRCFFAQIFR